MSCDASIKAVTVKFGKPLVKGMKGVEYEMPSEKYGRMKIEPEQT